jgi:hypothetical protein
MEFEGVTTPADIIPIPPKVFIRASEGYFSGCSFYEFLRDKPGDYKRKNFSSTTCAIAVLQRCS